MDEYTKTVMLTGRITYYSWGNKADSSSDCSLKETRICAMFDVEVFKDWD